tara:strand:- start:1327 stop:1512 length:186 start_codon:yes stop_codon:yes gene_type:complete
MPSTPFERTVLIRSQNRIVYIDPATLTTSKERTAIVEQQDRRISIERKPTSADRVVYANED